MHTHCRKWMFLLCILTLLHTTAAVFAAEAPVLRVGWYLVDGLHNMDPATGRYSGYDYDYLQSISQFTGWKYEFVIEPFGDCMKDLADGKLDLVGGVGKTPEREQIYTYPKNNIGLAGPRLAARENDTRFSYEEFAAFQGLRIGVVQSSSLQEQLLEYAQEHHFQPEIHPYRTPQEMQIALNNDEIDAVFISGTKDLSKLRILAQLPLQEIYFITTPDKAWIMEDLDRGISLLHFFNRSYEETLYDKYFAAHTSTVAFSNPERQYLERRRLSENPILVAYDPSWMPLEYRDPETGEFTGVMHEIFQLLQQRTGLNFQFVTMESFAQTDAAYNGKAEIYATASTDFNWAEQHNLYLTPPLFSAQIFMVYQNQNAADARIALPRDYQLSEMTLDWLAKNDRSLDDLSITYYDNTQACLEALLNNTADRTFINEYELNYYAGKGQLDGLHLQSIAGFKQKISIGVSKNADPQLLSILCRSLESISQNEISLLLVKNTRVHFEPGILDFMHAHPVKAGLFTAFCTLLPLLTLFFYYSSRRNRRQRIALEKANHAKSEFLSRISHDIRTPMNAIVGMTALAKNASPSPEIENYLSKIDTSSHFLLELINDILDMSAIEQGHILLHPEFYPLPEFQSLLEGSILPLAQQKKVHFQCTMDESLTCICVDRLRFNQIFLNLLTNAIKFTPANGTVRFSLQRLKTMAHTVQLQAVVADTGIGIQPEFLPQLFSPFSQANKAHISAEEGSGLGLAIVKNLLDALHGSISVQSELGKGTVFTIELTVPICTLPDTEPYYKLSDKKSLPEERPEDMLKGIRILVVEDNKLNQEVVCSLLEMSGIEWEVAEDGLAAIKKFSSQPPDHFQAILMDVRMPIMDGIEATQQIRSMQRPDAQHIPIIALTAEAYVNEREHILSSGMTEYLAKPVQPKKLLNLLQKIIYKTKK